MYYTIFCMKMALHHAMPKLRAFYTFVQKERILWESRNFHCKKCEVPIFFKLQCQILSGFRTFLIKHVESSMFFRRQCKNLFQHCESSMFLQKWDTLLEVVIFFAKKRDTSIFFALQDQVSFGFCKFLRQNNVSSMFFRRQC